MDYELCKQLKDAGLKSEMVTEPSGFNTPEGEYVNEPTLSELIDACGEEFGTLKKLYDMPDKWGVSDKGCASGGGEKFYFHAEGETPEEAVANLYLSLNPIPHGKEEGPKA